MFLAGSFLVALADCLDKHPVITKSVSSGFIGLLGDLTAQSFEWGFGGAPVPWNSTHVSRDTYRVHYDTMILVPACSDDTIQ